MTLRAALLLPVMAGVCLAQAGPVPPRLSTVRLTFTREQWRAMEPVKSGNGHMSFGEGEWLQGPKGKRNGLASAMGIEFPTAHAWVTIDDKTFHDVAVRYKGNGTYLEGQGAGKFSFKIDLDKFVKGQKYGGASVINLHNNVTDPTWMNEPLSYRLYRDGGVPAPRTSWARVFVTVVGREDNRYAGLYTMVENVDRDFLARHFANQGGALFKPVSTNLFRYMGEDWAKYDQTYDPKGGATAEQKQRMIDFTRLVTQSNDQEFAARLGEFVELDALARYMAVMVFLSDTDGILGNGQNFYMYLDPKTKKFTFLPWDQDHSFGQFQLIGSQHQRNNLSMREPWVGHKRFLERLFAAVPFKKLYWWRLDEFCRTIFQPARFATQVDEIAAVIRPSVEQEGKLDRFDRAVAGKSRSRVPIKPFVTLRLNSIVQQMAGKSMGEHIDGR